MNLSTHVLDTARGEPAGGVLVHLYRWSGDDWIGVAQGRTGTDGRLHSWAPEPRWCRGTYRLCFDTAGYFGLGAFFPEVSVVFVVTDAWRHLHVPLLISPYGYSTYRGS
ncbi:hydroxyisourate hydrolase [Micromonospora sp. DT43]|uniref:hydroxyisourate hydrolase n=1 Tax=Micromonospora sp. DT43 TaxID=3393440 RepID=UPI003CFB4D0F